MTDLDTKHLIIGLSYIVGTIFLYIGSSMLINAIYKDISNSPYFLTWITESFKVVYFIIYALPLKENIFHRSKHPVKKIVITGLVYGASMIIATYAFDLGLDYTTPSSGNSLNSTLSIFTCMFSIWILKEDKVNRYKIIACALVVIGIIVICAGDKANAPNRVLGDILCTASSVLYAISGVILKLLMKDDEGYPYFLMLGFCGLSILIVFWPGILILNAYGFERFIMPNVKELLLMFLVSISNALIPDYYYLKALMILGPTICTFSYTLIIPFSVLGDYLYEGTTYNRYFIIGILLIEGALGLILYSGIMDS